MLTLLRMHRLHLVEPNAAQALLDGVTQFELEAAVDAEPDVVLESMSVPAMLAPGQDGSMMEARVAVIPVRGYLLPSDLAHPLGLYTGYDWIVGKLREFSGQADAVLLDISSPGGTQAGALETAEIIQEVSRSGTPIFARVTDYAFSAAYWLASATDRIYAAPTSQVGSIGVLAMHFEYSEAMKKDGVKVTIFRAGEKKAAGNPFEPLDEDFAKETQAGVEKWFRIFAEHVAGSRGLDVGSVMGLESRVFDADEGKDLGLVDEVVRPDKALVSIMEEAVMAERNAVEEERNRVASILAHEAAQDWPKTTAKLIEAGVSAEAAAGILDALMSDFSAHDARIREAAEQSGEGAFERYMARVAEPMPDGGEVAKEASEADLMRAAYAALVGAPEGQN